jgi:AAA domain
MDAGDMYHDEEDIEEWRKSKKLNKNMNETLEKKAIVKGKKEAGARTYYGKVVIVGPSGSGKTYLSKTADKATTGLINIEQKPLSYKAEPFAFEGRPKNWTGFMKCITDYGANPDVHRIIIDSQSAAFSKLNNEMGKSYSGWDVPKNYNKQVYEYLELIKNMNKDVIIIAHDEMLKIDDGTKQRRIAVHNKEYEGKIEREYSLVLYTGTELKDEKPRYFLKTFEPDTSAKCPEGMFPDKNGDNLLEIPNSAQYIFDALEKYYS